MPGGEAVKKRTMTAIVVMLCIIMILIQTSAAFATEEYETYYARDDNISIELPENWYMEEYIEETYPGEYYDILYAEDSESGLRLNVYYNEVSSDGNAIEIQDSEDAAVLYYDEYGQKAVRMLFSDELYYSKVYMNKPEYYYSDINTYIVVKAEVNEDSNESFENIVYLTVYMTSDSEYYVNSILVFSKENNEDFTEAEKKEVQEIAGSFSDEGYYDVMNSEYDENNDGESGSFFSMILAVLAVALGGLKLLDGKKLKKAVSKPKDALAKQKNVKPKPDSGQKIRQKIQPRKNSKMQPAEAEDRYIRSLETLRKSGLLTKEEMKEMIDKHKRI